MPPARIRDARYFSRILEALYTGITARDVAGYAWAPSDGWTQSRTPGEWRAHLECWIDLGGTVRLDPHSYQHDCRLVCALRYHADDDSISQARMHAAMRDAAMFLLTSALPGSARVLTVSSMEIFGVQEGGWVEVTISFTLYLPR